MKLFKESNGHTVPTIKPSSQDTVVLSREFTHCLQIEMELYRCPFLETNNYSYKAYQLTKKLFLDTTRYDSGFSRAATIGYYTWVDRLHVHELCDTMQEP